MRRLKLLPLAVLASSLAAAMPSVAQEDKFLEPAVKEAAEINKSAAASQEKINTITDQLDTKLQRFKTTNKEIDGLVVYNAQLRKQLNNQLQEVADLNKAIDEVSVIERQITPLMLRMIEGLKQFVSLDVPFLPEERSKRLAELESLMERADVAPSEKFRRVMEAYQIEMDYGRTLEAYSGLHNVDGQERDVDFLRVGRTALIYQTRDASQQGLWNKQSRQWEVLPASYRTQVTKGLRMAKKQLAPDLLSLPVALTD
jgi:DNA repair exonuclease SbcCD ATPase subunit